MRSMVDGHSRTIQKDDAPIIGAAMISALWGRRHKGLAFAGQMSKGRA